MPKKIVDKDILDKRIIGEPQTEFPWNDVPVEIKEYCLVKADLNCNDPVAIFTHLLPTIGVCIGADTFAHCGDDAWFSQPSIQTMNVGRRSRAKTPAIKLGVEPLKILDQKLFKEHQKEYEAWEKKRDEATSTREKEKLLDMKPTRKDCQFGDITYEAIVVKLSRFPSALYRINEGRVFFGNLETGKKNNLGSINSLFDGECDSSERKGGSIKVDGYVNVCITMGIQSETLIKFFKNDDYKESGFVERFLYYYSDAELPPSDREYTYTKSDKERVENEMNKKVELLVEKQLELRVEYVGIFSESGNPWQKIRVLEIKGEALKRLRQIRDVTLNNKKFEEYGNKAASHIMRIALILTVFINPRIENGGLIELQEIETAIKIWKFYFHKYKELFNDNDKLESLKNSILTFIETNPTYKSQHVISEARIWQNFSKRLTTKGRSFFNEAIQSLVDDGLLTRVDSQNPRTKLYTIPELK